MTVEEARRWVLHVLEDNETVDLDRSTILVSGDARTGFDFALELRVDRPWTAPAVVSAWQRLEPSRMEEFMVLVHSSLTEFLDSGDFDRANAGDYDGWMSWTFRVRWLDNEGSASGQGTTG